MKYLLFCLIVLVGCRHKNTTDKDYIDIKTNYFKTQYLTKFKVLNLPCILSEYNKMDLDSIPNTDPNTLDSLFTGIYNLKCYGMHPDTNNFYTLFFYYPAYFVLIVSTYDKNGNQISSEGTDFGCWGGSPGDFDCDGSATIDEFLNIKITHTTTCYDCDTTSNKLIKFDYLRKGVIDKKGHIKLGEGITKKIINEN